MIVLGNPQEVEEYFADSSINQSYLKQLIKGVEHLDQEESTLYYEEKGHFLIGGAMDVYMTQGIQNFNAQYHISNIVKPSDAIMSIVKRVYDNVKHTFIEDVETELLQFEQEILDSAAAHSYQKRWKPETLIRSIGESGQVYFNELRASEGKKILSKVQGTTVENIIMSLKSSRYTNEYFKDSVSVDIYYQVAIYFEYRGVPCKALLDMVRVDSVNKTIEVIDLKTTGGFVVSFSNAIKSFRYDFQGAFYKEAILALVEGRAKCEKIKQDFSDYIIGNFKFIVETTKTKTDASTGEVTYYTGKPMVFELAPHTLKLAREGRPELVLYATPKRENLDKQDFNNTIEYKAIVGVEEALDLYKWHLEHGFEEDKIVYESGGIITV